MWAASARELMHEKGYKVIAISDVSGGIYNPNGLNIPDVLDYLKKNKTLEGYPGSGTGWQ